MTPVPGPDLNSRSIQATRRATAGLQPQVFPFIVGISAALLALLAAVGGPVLALQALAVLLVFVLTNRRPEYVLAAGVAGTLAGGEFRAISSYSTIVLLVGACASIFTMVTRRLHVRWQRLALPMGILLWLGFRVALERDFLTASAAAQCVAALLIVLHCLQDRRDVVRAMAVGGIFFATASVWLGVENLTGSRFEGISGNPNRMVFGLLLFLPFICTVLLASRSLPVRLLAVMTAVVTVVLVIRSGSDQGVVGLAVVVIVLVLCWTAGLAPAPRATIVLIVAAGLVVYLDSAIYAIQSSLDLRTLSGRTSIYSAALQSIARHPLIGSGRQHFSEGVVMERSAHSAVLGLASTGGVLLGIAWIAVIVVLMVITVSLIRRRSPLAAAPAVLLSEQLVQTVQLVPLTWAIIAFFLLAHVPGKLQTGRPGEASLTIGAAPEAADDRERRVKPPAPIRNGRLS